MGLVLLAGLVLAAPAAATFPGTNGRIAFSQGDVFPDGDLSLHSQVFTVDPDGGDIVQLTDVAKSRSAALPDWSPDGSRIAFQSNRSGDFGIWLMNADGSGQVRLTGRAGFGDFYPSWSPDGRRLLYSHCAEALGMGFFFDCAIAVIDADAGNRETLLGSGHWLYSRPQFSPDGHQIAFSSDRGGFQGAIWVMNADGSSPRRITKPRLRAFWPDWAPSGDRILFADHCCVKHSNIYTVRPDGSDLQRITGLKASSLDAAFAGYSPDGTRVTFSFNKGCPTHPPFCNHFYTMAADGSDFQKVVTGRSDTLLTDWGSTDLP
jgi:Tol biopolymer transport system component